MTACARPIAVTLPSYSAEQLAEPAVGRHHRTGTGVHGGDEALVQQQSQRCLLQGRIGGEGGGLGHVSSRVRICSDLLLPIGIVGDGLSRLAADLVHPNMTDLANRLVSAGSARPIVVDGPRREKIGGLSRSRP